VSLLQEDLIGLAALAVQIRSHRRKGHVTAQAVWRWATAGVRLADGTILKLETVRLAGRFLTSYPAFLRFVGAQSAPVESTPLPASRTPQRRQRDSEIAGAAMESVGI
jgi:hypothetical protein